MLIIGRLPFIDCYDSDIIGACDMIHIPIKRTSDDVLVVSKSPYVLANKHQPKLRTITLEDAQLLDPGLKLVRSVVSKLAGNIFLDLEVSEKRTSNLLILMLEETKFTKHLEDLLVSSSSGGLLLKFRRHFPKLKLSLITDFNPYVFVAWERLIGLSGVSFHRLHVTHAAIEAAANMNLLACAYTVDRPRAAALLEEKGIEAIITDSPLAFKSD